MTSMDRAGANSPLSCFAERSGGRGNTWDGVMQSIADGVPGMCLLTCRTTSSTSPPHALAKLQLRATGLDPVGVSFETIKVLLQQ